MKMKKQCPECDGREIYTAETVIGGATPTRNLLPDIGSVWSGTKIDVFVCGRCGCQQIFVAQEHLEEVKEKWRQHV